MFAGNGRGVNGPTRQSGRTPRPAMTQCWFNVVPASPDAGPTLTQHWDAVDGHPASHGWCRCHWQSMLPKILVRWQACLHSIVLSRDSVWFNLALSTEATTPGVIRHHRLYLMTHPSKHETFNQHWLNVSFFSGMNDCV